MKNKKIQVVSIVCVIIFSVFSFLMNFSFAPNHNFLRFQNSQSLTEIFEESKTPELLGTYTAGNSGTIETWDEFVAFRDSVNGGNNHKGKTITLRNDIDCAGKTFIPVGTIKTSGGSATSFAGKFNGNGYALKNVKIESGTNVYGDIGVFGYINGATISNLTVTVTEMKLTTAGKSIGGLVGSASGKCNITKCIIMPASSSSKIYTSNTTANVSMNVGGIVGYANMSSSTWIKTCANYVPLTNHVYGDAVVGGIVGRFPSTSKLTTIDFCCNKGNLSAGCSNTTTAYLGGIVGICDASKTALFVSHCLNDATLSADSKNHLTGSSVSGSGGVQETTLRDIDNVIIRGFSKTYYDNYTRNIYAGGIIGKSNINYISDCVNLGSNSVRETSYKETSKYFFGDYGDTPNSVDCRESWYGDYIEFVFYQDIENIREIGFGYSINSSDINYSVTYGDYYNTYGWGDDYDRVYFGKAGSSNGQYININALSAAELFEDANTNNVYIYNSSTFYQQLTLPSAWSNYKVTRTANVDSTAYNGVNFYNADHGWLWGGLYNTYGTKYNPYQLGLNVIYIPQTSSGIQIPGIYDSSLVKIGQTVQWPFYGYSFTSTAPHYMDIRQKDILRDQEFESYYHERFITGGSDDDCSSGYKDKNYNRKIIGKNKITTSTSGSNINFTHSFQYHYWKDNKWYTNTGSFNFGAAASRANVVSNTKDTSLKIISSSNYQTTINMLNNSYDEWTLKNGKPYLKWLDWASCASTPS